jgi:integrase
MASRRGNNEGTIVKRADGRWEARVTLNEGKRKCLYGKTRQEVARRLTEVLRDRDRGLPVVGDRQTVAEYTTNWLQTIRPTVSSTTVHKYKAQLRIHILPLIGTLKLSRLTAQHLQTVYSKGLANRLSSTSVRLLHTIMHGALKDAVRLGLLPRNVADMVSSPRKRHPEMHVLTPEQARTFLKTAEGSRYAALFVVALTTGMREGELLALR